MEVKWSEFATVIAGRYTFDAILGTQFASCGDASARRLADIRIREAVDDDFHDRFDSRRQLGSGQTFERWTEGIVGRSEHGFVFGADLGPGAHHTTGERHDDVGYLAHGFNCRFAGGQCLWLRFCEYQEITAADGAHHARGFFGDEFAIHDRHAPVALTAELLGDLIAVAEKAQVLAQIDAGDFGIPAVDAGESRSRRAGQYALPHAGFQLLHEHGAAHGKHEDCHARPSVRSFCWTQFALDASFHAAADDRSSKASHGMSGVVSPFMVLRGDDDARAAHVEGFGEGVVDGDAINDHAVFSLRPLHSWTTTPPRPPSAISSLLILKCSIFMV